jgi:hypothetical protein
VLSNIKLWLTVAAGVIMSALYAMLKISNAERDQALSDKDKAVAVNESNAKEAELDESIKQVKDDVSAMSDSSIDDSLQQYNRSREDKD